MGVCSCNDDNSDDDLADIGDTYVVDERYD